MTTRLCHMRTIAGTLGIPYDPTMSPEILIFAGLAELAKRGIGAHYAQCVRGRDEMENRYDQAEARVRELEAQVRRMREAARHCAYGDLLATIPTAFDTFCRIAAGCPADEREGGE